MRKAISLFESGAIVFHVAQRHAGLLPVDANARARAITWMFAALNTMEPPIVDRQIAILLEGNETCSKQRLSVVEERIHKRLGQLSSRLGDDDWLDGEFSAGDLLMATVLRRLGGIRLVGRTSKPHSLRRQSRSAARAQARFRRSIGSFHCRSYKLKGGILSHRRAR